MFGGVWVVWNSYKMAGLVEQEGQQVIGIDEEGQNKVTENKRTHLEGERDMMAPAAGSSIHRSGSRPQLDVSKAEIQGNVEEKYPTILLPNQSDDLSHLALDIGGMFVYMVIVYQQCSC